MIVIDTKTLFIMIICHIHNLLTLMSKQNYAVVLHIIKVNGDCRLSLQSIVFTFFLFMFVYIYFNCIAAQQKIVLHASGFHSHYSYEGEEQHEAEK